MTQHLLVAALGVALAGCVGSPSIMWDCKYDTKVADPTLWPNYDLTDYEGAWSIALPTADNPDASLVFRLDRFAWTSDWIAEDSSAFGPDDPCFRGHSRHIERTFNADVTISGTPMQTVPFLLEHHTEDETRNFWYATAYVSVMHLDEPLAFITDLVDGYDYDLSGITDISSMIRSDIGGVIGGGVRMDLYIDHAARQRLPYGPHNSAFISAEPMDENAQ